MNRIWGLFILFSGRFQAMSSQQQIYAIWHIAIDLFIFTCLIAMVYVGLTEDANAFFVWVPVLSFLTWVRFNQMRKRWSP